MVAKEFGMFDTDDFTLALASYLREVAEHLAYRTLVLILRSVFFFQYFSEAKRSGISTTAHFAVNHLLQTIDQPKMEMMSLFAEMT